MDKEKTKYATVKCPYCLKKHKFVANFEEWRILFCSKCKRSFNIEPLNKIKPFVKDDRMNDIHRLTEEDINHLMSVAFDLGDIEYVKELAERKKHLHNGYWVGDISREDDKDYYGE